MITNASSWRTIFIVSSKTLLAVLLLTPALTFWYILVLLLLAKQLPASLGIEVLTIGDIISLPIVSVFAVVVGVMAAIYFTADTLEQT